MVVTCSAVGVSDRRVCPAVPVRPYDSVTTGAQRRLSARCLPRQLVTSFHGVRGATLGVP